MKQKIHLLLLMSSLFLLFYACRKELDDSPAQEDSFLKEAWNFYYASKKQQTSGKLSSVKGQESTNLKLTPLWGRAYRSSTEKYQFVEVPMLMSKKEIPVYNFSGTPLKREDQLKIVNASFQRLLIYQDKKGHFSECLITYIPDLAYLARHGYDASDNQLNKMRQNFSGYLHSTTLNGKEIQIVRYEEGKAVKKYQISRTNKPAKKGEMTTLGYECYEICTDWYNIVCYWEGDPAVLVCGEPQYVYTTCEVRCVSVPDPDPLPDPDPCPTGDCGGGGGGSGGGGSEGPPTEPIPDPELTKDFCSNTETNMEAQNIINNSLNTYKNDNCATKYIYDALAMGHFALTFCIDPTKPFNATYTPATNTLAFQNTFTATMGSIVEHEMFHAYQDMFYGGTNAYGHGQPGNINIEFEQAVMADIAQGYATAFGVHGTLEQQRDYNAWLASITNNFTQYPSLAPGTTAYENFIQGYFNQLNIYNGLPGNPYAGVVLNSLYPNAMLHVLRSTTKNCQ